MDIPMKSNTSWLEISLTVDGELAEAVAEVLRRFIPNGVAIESTAIYADPEDEGYPIGPLRVCGYLQVDDRLEETRQKVEEALWYLGRISPLPAPQFSTVQEQDWAEAWKQHYHPIAIGRRLIIVPAWLESPDPARIPIRMDPGMAFGTGTHPTTQLCLELAEAVLIDRGQPVDGPPPTAIDVGCGSGILSVAALKLGATHALGMDIDPRAVEVSLENAALNGVADRYTAGTGSVAEILKGDFDLRQAPLVFANILAPVLVRLFEDGLAELVSPGGHLILSGILADQQEAVLAAASAHGMALHAQRQITDWVALCVKPISPHPLSIFTDHSSRVSQRSRPAGGQ
jgi:ribosomal protein L11 methyltransferase